MKFHYLASQKKKIKNKRKQRKKDDNNESSGEELSSYEGYDEYMPFTEDDANIFRFHKENNNGHHIKNMTGCIPETIPDSFIGQTPRVKDKSINESELLKENKGRTYGRFFTLDNYITSDASKNPSYQYVNSTI